MSRDEFERKIHQLRNDAEDDFADNVQSLYDAVRGVDGVSRRVLVAYVLQWPDGERERLARHLLGDAAQKDTND